MKLLYRSQFSLDTERIQGVMIVKQLTYQSLAHLCHLSVQLTEMTIKNKRRGGQSQERIIKALMKLTGLPSFSFLAEAIDKERGKV